MNLLESLEFIENNWDMCNQDPQIAQALQDSSLSQCESFFENEVEKLEQNLLQNYSQDPELKHIFDSINSSFELFNSCMEKLLNINLETKPESTTSVERDISDFFTECLPIILSSRPKKRELYKVYCFFQKYPDLYKYYPKFNKVVKSKIESWISYLVTNISKVNYKNDKIKKKCLSYYDYFKKMVNQDENEIQKLQHNCIERLVLNIIHNNLEKSPHYSITNEKKIVTDLLAFEPLTPKKTQMYNFHVYTEFRIIKFIIELPLIMQDSIGLLPTVMNDERFSFKDFFETRLQYHYTNFLKKFKFTNGDFNQNAMKWLFIFRISIFHYLTAKIDSPFNSAIMKMIYQTVEISNANSNNFYNKYIQNSPLNTEYHSIILEVGHPNSITDYKKKETYVNKVISILKKDLHPLVKKISIYYADLIKFRENKDKPWYDAIATIITQENNMWMLRFLSFVSKTQLFEDLSYATSLPENLFLTLISYTNIYISCYKELLDQIVTLFGEYFIENIAPCEQFKQNGLRCFVDPRGVDISGINEDFINNNFERYINEAKKLVISKIDLVGTDQKGFFSIFSKNKFMDDDKNLAIIGLIYLFAYRFKICYSNLCNKINKNGTMKIPDVNKPFEGVMMLIEERFQIKHSVFRNFFKIEFNILFPDKCIF